jgi:hypothetical protein
MSPSEPSATVAEGPAQELDPPLGGLLHLCLRPCVYRVQTFRELVALIDGFELGCFVSGTARKAGWMAAFGEWLTRRAGREGFAPWDEILLGQCEGDEGRAMEQLGPLMREFLASGSFGPYGWRSAERGAPADRPSE